jgi:hypothetical protein
MGFTQGFSIRLCFSILGLQVQYFVKVGVVENAVFALLDAISAPHVAYVAFLVIASSIRRKTHSLPRIAKESNSPSPTDLPVAATRTG